MKNALKLLKALCLAAVLCAAPACAQGGRMVFSSADLKGTAVTQEIVKQARLTVFNVWGTFCSPCLREMPDLGRLADELAPQGVQFVGVVADWHDRKGRPDRGQIEHAAHLSERTGAKYLHILLTPDFVESVGSFNVVPMTFFVRSDGTVASRHMGARSGGEWRSLIEEELKKCQ